VGWLSIRRWRTEAPKEVGYGARVSLPIAGGVWGGAVPIKILKFLAFQP